MSENTRITQYEIIIINAQVFKKMNENLCIKFILYASNF